MNHTKQSRPMIFTSTFASALAMVVFMTTSVQSNANEIQNSQKDNSHSVPGESIRSEKRIGAYLGLLGDPHPTLAGFNVAYNLNDMMRASVGMGKISAGASVSVNDEAITAEETSMTTIGAALKFMVPGWNLTPSGSLGYSHVSMSSTNGGGFELLDYKANNFYVGLGGDFQAENGFNVGLGLNVSVNGAAPTAPYINLGYFL
jgi:hypothetical protein